LKWRMIRPLNLALFCDWQPYDSLLINIILMNV
jgi:hypothetical protein